MDYGIFYENGLYDAWKAAKRLRELSSEEREKIFGGSINDVFNWYTASEVIEKIKKYDESKEIKVDDIVTSWLAEGEKGIVVSVIGSVYYVIWEKTAPTCCNKTALIKIGHIDLIKELLETLKNIKTEGELS